MTSVLFYLQERIVIIIKTESFKRANHRYWKKVQRVSSMNKLNTKHYIVAILMLLLLIIFVRAFRFDKFHPYNDAPSNQTINNESKAVKKISILVDKVGGRVHTPFG